MARVSKPRVYHVVAIKEPGAQRWAISFGDYDKETAKQELADQKEADSFLNRGAARSQFRLVTVQGAGRHVTQAEIDSIVARLNAASFLQAQAR